MRKRPTDSTAEQQYRNLRPWQPGQSGNPAGRPKGSRNKLGEQFIADLYADWLAHGVAAIEMVRENRPQDYLKVIASIIPRQIELRHLDDISDDEVIARIRQLDQIVRPFLSNGSGGSTAH